MLMERISGRTQSTYKLVKTHVLLPPVVIVAHQIVKLIVIVIQDGPRSHKLVYNPITYIIHIYIYIFRYIFVQP